MEDNKRKNTKREMPICTLYGDERQWETQQARMLLDKAGVRYLFAHGDRLSDVLPQLNVLFTDYTGLEGVARFVARRQYLSERKAS
jgi:hypothetical protein